MDYNPFYSQGYYEIEMDSRDKCIRTGHDDWIREVRPGGFCYLENPYTIGKALVIMDYCYSYLENPYYIGKALVIMKYCNCYSENPYSIGKGLLIMVNCNSYLENPYSICKVRVIMEYLTAVKKILILSVKH